MRGRHLVEAGGHRLSLKVSIGVASLGEHGGSWDELVNQADRAMYAAKRAGRNRVIVGDAPPAAAALPG